MKINEDTILVLEKTSTTDALFIDQIPIINPLSDEFSKVFEMFENEKITPQEILKYAYNRMYGLFSEYRYCVDIKGSYEGVNFKYKYLLDSIDETKYTNVREALKIKFKKVKLAYSHYVTRTKLDSNSNIISFSHRRLGWNTDSWKGDGIFSFKIMTNFGYGYANHFDLLLLFREIELIRYADFVRYRNVNAAEIISCTVMFSLDDDNWLTAFNYIIEAFQLYKVDQAAFINKYVISQCEELVRGLEELLLTDTFHFYKNVKPFAIQLSKSEGVDIIKLERRPLVEFRGAKVSDALKFIVKISNLENYVNVPNLTNRIIAMNRGIQPVLEHEIALIIPELEKLNFELIPIEKDYTEKQSLYTNLQERKTQLRNELVQIDKNNDDQESKYNDYSSDNTWKEKYPGFKTFEELFLEKFPEWTSVKTEYEKINEIYQNHLSKISSLGRTKKNIEEYNSTIVEYFRSNELSLAI